MDFKTEYRYGEMLYKRFTKMNRKREKKGQPPLTQDEFAKAMRREYRVLPKKKMIFIEIAAALLVVLSGLRDAFTWVDLMGASAVFLIVFCIFHMSFVSQQSVSAAVLEILDRCEEQGIDIVTYWENL